jgi:amino acid adenylation domain-containing protein
MTRRNYSGDLAVATSQLSSYENYWLEKLSGELTMSSFPFYHIRRGSKEREIDSLEFRFSGECSADLMKLSNQSDSRLFMILTAGIIALIEKYTGNQDIMVGCPILKQEKEGDFINTVLVLRNLIGKRQTFKELLLEVRKDLLESTENQNFPIEMLLEQLDMTHFEENSFLFDIAILLENIHDIRYIRQTAPNMVFSFLRENGVVKGAIEYNKMVFEETGLKRLLQHLEMIFNTVIKDVNTSLRDTEILTETEKQQLLMDFNNTEMKYPKDKTITEQFEEQVEKIPNDISVVYEQDHLTYRGLLEYSNRVAILLRQNGTTAGSIVGIIIERSVEMIVGIFGILKSGGAYLPIDPEYPEKRILSMLGESDVRNILTRECIEAGFSYTGLSNISLGEITPKVIAGRANIEDLDSLPIPNRTLINSEMYQEHIGIGMSKHTISLQATRGCPFTCLYCHKIWPKTHVYRSAEHIFEEIRYCYEAGVRRFIFVDDIFNLNVKNSSRLLKKLLEHKMKVQLFFPNGLRGDILTKSFIDLMIEAGTINIDLALETASPRLQKLVGKNLNLEKFRRNIEYITQTYPHVVLEMEMMVGFPTETEEEAQMTYEFLEKQKWIHFPNLNILKIFPNTDMYRLAKENGVTDEAIACSTHLRYHELPETLPFSKSFIRKFQAAFVNEYLFSKERLKSVLPYQLKVFTEDELIQKYDSYLPMKINSFPDVLQSLGLSPGDLGEISFLQEDHMSAPDFSQKIARFFPVKKENQQGLRILLLDLSVYFSLENIFFKELVEEPLGLICLMTYLERELGHKIIGKLAKSNMDFDSYQELKALIEDFQPDLIGIRTLSLYKDFFHKTVDQIKEWGITAPIIAGGPYATSDYRYLLLDPHVELAVLGEGELIFTDIVKKMLDNHNRFPEMKELEEIKGIAYVVEEDKERLRKQRRNLIPMEKFAAPADSTGKENLKIICQPEDLAYVIYTSGSTGKPKGVMLEHRNLNNLIWGLHERIYKNYNPGARVALVSPYYFDASVKQIFAALVLGHQLHIVPEDIRIDGAGLGHYYQKHQIEISDGTPSHLSLILNSLNSLEGDRLKFRVKHFLIGGETLPKALVEVFLNRFEKNPPVIANLYGPTECCVDSTCYEVHKHQVHDIDIIPIGTPMPNCQAYLLGTYNALLPIGVPGELMVGGDGISRGYIKQSKLTAEKFVPHPFEPGKKIYRTGDLARWDTKGNVEYLGRIDQQVKIRGFRIEIGDIEHQLLAYPWIQEAVVRAIRSYATTDTGNGDPSDRYLCAWYVSERELESSDLRDFLSRELPQYMIPLNFMRVDHMPLTPNGKVDRKALPDPGIGSTGKYITPTKEVEKKLVYIWSKVLGIDEDAIGLSSNFFELGGHSLKATILISRIHKEFDVRVPLAQIFKTQKVKNLAEYIEESSEDTFEPVYCVEKKDYYPLSSAQKRLYILYQMDVTRTGYNSPRSLLVEGEIKKEKLEQVFCQLIKRHENLRTFFQLVSEEPVQRIAKKPTFRVEYTEASEDKARGIINQFVRPFQLSQAPLLRVGMIKLEQARSVLLVDMHHVISDGTSTGLLINDFMKLYKEEQVPELRIQYKDYSEWQNKEKQKDKFRKQEDFWLQQFKDEIPVMNLPLDSPRPAMQSFEGGSVAFEIGPEETKTIRRYNREKDTTQFMTLLGLINILLARISLQEDIIIGTTVEGRRHADLSLIMGMFVNNLALRNYPKGTLTMEDFLQEVKERTMAVFENQEYQFEDLVDQLGTKVRRDLSRNPIFDVMFALQNISRSSLEISGLRLQPYGQHSMDSKFDMTFNAVESDDRIYFSIEFCTKLFKKETLQRLSLFFKQILAQFLREPGKQIQDTEIIPEIEKNQVLYQFNETEEIFSGQIDTRQLIKDRIMESPDNIALVFENQAISYREMGTRIYGLASGLNHQGMGKGDIVAVLADRSLEMVLGILGVLMTSALYLPLDPKHPLERITYILKDSATQWILTQEKYAQELSRGEPGVHPSYLLDLYDPSLYKEPRTLDQSHYSPKDLVYVTYTSGSTGNPKGVLVKNASLYNFIQAMLKQIQVTEKDKLLSFTTLSFDIFGLELFLPLTQGSTMVLGSEEEQLDASGTAEMIYKNKITLYQTTPSRLQVNLTLTLAQRRTGLEQLNYLLVGGEAFPQPLLRQVKELVKGRIINLYGPTETTIWSTLKDVTQDPWPEIGSPILNTRIYVLDNQGLLQPIGIPGELCISGTGVARGYLNRVELTHEAFLKNPFKEGDTLYRTGDIASWNSEGNLHFSGRRDYQVKVRGYRIELGEIEHQLNTHPNIKENVVVSVREKETHDTLLASYIVANQEIPVQDVREYLLKKLPDYMIPSYFIFMDKIPLNTSGKVDRSKLPQPEYRGTEGYKGPENQIQEILVKLWSVVLGIEEKNIGIYDNFFALGGHSLRAVILLAKVHKELKKEISLAELFNDPTIKGLSHCIRKTKESVEYTYIKPVEQRDYYEASSEQTRLYVMHQMEAGRPAFNLTEVFVMQQTEILLIENIFKKLIQRHESLRTGFEVIDGQLVQRVKKSTDFKVDYFTLKTEEPSLEFELVKNFIKPFDLNFPPLFRVGYVKVGEIKALLIVDMHHIISDLVSHEILVRDFISLLKGNQLPPLKFQYKDFSQWQKTEEIQAQIGEQENYWMEKYKGKNPQLNLPIDFSRKPDKVMDGGIVGIRIDKQKTQRLRKLGLEKGVSIYMMLLALYTILLSKLCLQDEIVVGTPTAGRKHAGLEEIVGLFVNLLPMKNNPEAQKTFEEFLAEVKKNSLEAFENQDYPFNELVEKLGIERGTSRNPLAETHFMYQGKDDPGLDESQSSPDHKDLSASSYNDRVVRHDITLTAKELTEQINLIFRYKINLFKRETIENYSLYFINILEKVVSTPNIKIADIELLSLQERKKIHTMIQKNEDILTHLEGEDFNEAF